MQKRYIKLGTLLLAGLYWAVPVHADLIHRYSFTTDASDSVGTANATLNGVATVAGGQLQFNNPNFTAGVGTNPNDGYATLPPSVLPSSGSATIEEWMTIQGSGFFAESYSFSNSNNDANPPSGAGGQYLLHAISAPQPATPPGGANTGGDHVEQTLNGYSLGQQSDAYETTPGLGAFGGGYMDDGDTYFSATVIDGTAGTLSYYLWDITAGGIGGLQQTIPAIPLSSYSFTNAYLGRSPFTVDNILSGSMDEFRIYNDAQSPSQILGDFAAGPDVVVPEPASLSLLVLGAVGLLKRRSSLTNR